VRRLLAGAFLVVCLVAGVIVTAGAGGGGGGGNTYKVVLDNAFGLTQGADMKVAGVRAGKVQSLDVDRRTARAIVTVSVSRAGFGSFRSDVFCEVRPQSLIGEYYLDCDPGKSARVLAPGSTIPVTHTASTIAPDIVQDILREPYRERLRIILNELGAGLAARGPDLNATIRRAVPALRETDRVLKILADDRQTIRSLSREADGVLSRLAANRRNVGRFVVAARNSAVASADRRAALAATVHKLPGFLEQLRPTLADLGTAAREQTPTLADLRASAPSLTSFFNRLGPFANASRPAIKSLGKASVTGRRAAIVARPTVAELRRFATPSPEVSHNLAMILADLDDRSRATEPDSDSPGGKGYTGLEALLQYPFDQSLAINIFDQRGYLLKLNALVNECGSYTDAASAKSNAERYRKCNAGLGPNQPGVTTPDPTATAQAKSRSHRTRRTHHRRATSAPSAPAPAPSAPSAPKAPSLPSPPSLPPVKLPPIKLPPVPGIDQVKPPQLPRGTDQSTKGLLDYLLGP